jgi:hypothetical protein
VIVDRSHINYLSQYLLLIDITVLLQLKVFVFGIKHNFPEKSVNNSPGRGQKYFNNDHLAFAVSAS